MGVGHHPRLHKLKNVSQTRLLLRLLLLRDVKAAERHPIKIYLASVQTVVRVAETRPICLLPNISLETRYASETSIKLQMNLGGDQFIS
ncbi:hypothetical protein AVEN_55337-1 [Araneus ventricosus]|uniref:Uncharacterized protein n=1 Tax=Araneus ventricosus TaxID=182803 RepID=A0A4Y2DC18_ARAVE|nr:hypothetical protein AVEN_55337-1 [Araneus ventricosus]